MAQTKPKAAQFYGVSGDGTAGQVLISDGNGGMFWGANTEQFTVSWNTPTGQGLTYTQPSPQSSEGTAGSAFPTTTFTVTKSDTIISGTATIAGLPTGVTATQVITGSGIGNTLTLTLSGVFPGADSLNTDLTLSGLTLSKTVSWATPTGQGLTYTEPSPQSSIGNPGTAFPTTTFTATKSGETISGTATITGLPTGITATQSLSGSGANNVLTVTLTGVFPGADSLNTALTISGLTIVPALTVDYLVVAGGGSGGLNGGAGGGAGGLRASFGTTSGGGSSAETTPILFTGTNYTVTVGAAGSDSTFNTITSTAGGVGGNIGGNGSNGGSGGGGGTSYNSGTTYTGGSATAGQGYAGGSGMPNVYSPSNLAAGGGGGAASTGGNAPSFGTGGNGGAGLEVNIIGGTGNYYAGGGAGGGGTAGGAASPGVGGGGTAGDGSTAAGNGTPNTGGGGGGGGNPSTSSGSGGSGIVILRYPDIYNITVGSGLITGTLNAAVGSDKKYTTFTGGTGTITFGAV